MKLIIDIPEDAYKVCKKIQTSDDDGYVGLCVVNATANGTPLSAEGEYIKKEDALSLIRKYGDMSYERVNALPTYSFPEREKGEWVYGIDEETGSEDMYAFTCSVCRGKYPWQPKYCPNCGREMVRGKADETN